MQTNDRLFIHRTRALKIANPDADFLVRRVAEELAARIGVTNREFLRGVDMLSLSDCLAVKIRHLSNVKAMERYETAPVATLLNTINRLPTNALGGIGAILPGVVDLVVSAFGLHWTKNIADTLSAVLDAMKSDGLLLVALPLQGTLRELNDCLTRAELELTDGAAMRVDKFVSLQQAGGFLQQAGFALPVVDREDICVRYDNMFALIDDLRAMGVTSLFAENDIVRTHRELFKRADFLYRENYSDSDERIRASFCIGYLTGWVPHESQQKPLRPGSAVKSLADQLRLEPKL